MDLPIELLELIASFINDKSALLHLLCLSRIWNAATTRALYQELELDLSDWSKKARQKVQLLERIGSRIQFSSDSNSKLNAETWGNDLGIHVHSLLVLAPFSRTDERQDVEQTVVRALRCMPNLKSLNISALSNFLIDIPSSDSKSPIPLPVSFPYPFQLERFFLHTAIVGPGSLDVFLSNQPQIHMLTCNYPYDERPAKQWVDDAGAFLPHLGVFSAGSDVSLSLVKGRPVTHCRVMQLTPPSLELLAQSSQPVVGLAIDNELYHYGLDPHPSLSRLEFLACKGSPVSLGGHI